MTVEARFCPLYAGREDGKKRCGHIYPCWAGRIVLAMRRIDVDEKKAVMTSCV